MLLSRYIPIIAPLALAGSLAAKPAAPETAGSLRADSATFGVHALGRGRHPRPADVHAGRRARTDCRAPGAGEVAGRRSMLKAVRQAVLFTAVTMVLFGGVYHAAIWGLGRLAFPSQAEGSLIRRADGTVVGSRLIAQKFTRPEYFQPRPSAVDYNAASTGGSNFGPSNPDHLEGGAGSGSRRDRAAGGRPGRAGAVRDGDRERRRPRPAHPARRGRDCRRPASRARGGFPSRGCASSCARTPSRPLSGSWAERASTCWS